MGGPSDGVVVSGLVLVAVGDELFTGWFGIPAGGFPDGATGGRFGGLPGGLFGGPPELLTICWVVGSLLPPKAKTPMATAAPRTTSPATPPAIQSTALEPFSSCYRFFLRG